MCQTILAVMRGQTRKNFVTFICKMHDDAFSWALQDKQALTLTLVRGVKRPRRRLS